MSLGSPRITFRIDAGTIEEMHATIALRNANTREEPWTTSDFVTQAIREKIAKMERSRGYRKAAREGKNDQVAG